VKNNHAHKRALIIKKNGVKVIPYREISMLKTNSGFGNYQQKVIQILINGNLYTFSELSDNKALNINNLSANVLRYRHTKGWADDKIFDIRKPKKVKKVKKVKKKIASVAPKNKRDDTPLMALVKNIKMQAHHIALQGHK